MNPMVRWTMVLTAVVMIAVGGAWYAFEGSAVGLVIAGIGVFDLLTMPLTMRMIGRARSTAASEPAPAEPAPVEESPDPTADPSYNPYARED